MSNAWRNLTLADLVRRNSVCMLCKASARYQLFEFRSILLQTSSSQVRSPREIYSQVHNEIINITCMIFCCIST